MDDDFDPRLPRNVPHSPIGRAGRPRRKSSSRHATAPEHRHPRVGVGFLLGNRSDRTRHWRRGPACKNLAVWRPRTLPLETPPRPLPMLKLIGIVPLQKPPECPSGPDPPPHSGPWQPPGQLPVLGSPPAVVMMMWAPCISRRAATAVKIPGRWPPFPIGGARGHRVARLRIRSGVQRPPWSDRRPPCQVGHETSSAPYPRAAPLSKLAIKLTANPPPGFRRPTSGPPCGPKPIPRPPLGPMVSPKIEGRPTSRGAR